nr:putative ribonuclease H-like domain-containing protein [Tanacetum cinerariifolium]
KAYELLVVKEKHDELMKQSLLTKSHYEGLVNQKTKVITDLKLRKEHDIEKMLSMEKQLKFLNEVVYKRSQSIQTIHMMAPKVKECECLAQKLSKQTEFVSKKVHTELLQHFAKVEKHSISLEIALQNCKEQIKNHTLCNEKASNDFRKEREQYFEIQDLKAKLQDKNIAISELKKLIEHGKAKSVDTKFDRPSVVRQPNAQRIPKPSVFGKPTPFSNSLDRIYFQKTRSVSKANVSEGLSKPVTAQTLPQTAKKAISNTNVLTLGLYRIDNRIAHTRAPQLPQTIVQLIIFIIDSGCTKHITGNLKLLCNFIEKYLGTIHFGNDQFAPILGYGDLVQGNVTINKRSSFKSKAVPSSKGRLNLLHMDLWGPMRVTSINGKKYILVIIDDYSRYTWNLFQRSKDKTPEVLKDFLMMIQRNLQAPVITVRTDGGTKFLNKTLNAFFKEEGIEHQTSTARTPEQNGVVERRNRTLVEAARTMLSASQLPLSFGLKQLQPLAILKTDP